MNKKCSEQIEDILKLAREEKINEQELLKQSIEEKNKFIEEQKIKIEELEQKNKDLYKQLLSLKAEFENFRKRTDIEKQKKFFLGKLEIIENVISLYEMFSLALENIKNYNSNSNQIIEGVRLLYKEFENFLLKQGVKKIDCINQTFNHFYHEVVDYEEDLSKEDGTILQVISNGYLINDNNEEYIIKPAKVKVVKNKKENENLNNVEELKSENFEEEQEEKKNE